VDYTAAGMLGLTNVAGNDRLGDCTAAQLFHYWCVVLGNTLGLTPELVAELLADVVPFYSASTGYVPGDPATDQGADELTVIQFAKSRGLAGHRIQGAISVDATNPTLVATANWLFGGTSLCVELPSAWTANEPSGPGFTWDVNGPPNPQQGHCICGVGHNNMGLQIDTWGLVSDSEPSTVTWAALAAYGATSAGGSLNAFLAPEWVSKVTGNCPAGLDLQQLLDDMAELGEVVS
jgi:hypothetical protein